MKTKFLRAVCGAVQTQALLPSHLNQQRHRGNWPSPWILSSALLCLAPEGARAAQSGDFTYSSDGSAIAITDYTGPGGAVTIPGIINGLPVTTIGSHAFDRGTNLTSVTIPVGVTSIGSWAFAYCPSLTGVTVPNSVISIGDSAFHTCPSLVSVTLPDSMSSLGGYAFFQCSNLASVIIPSGVPRIGDRTFYRCTSLTSITIPASVASIGDSAFESCTTLATITIPNGVASIGDTAFHSCASLLNVTIPASVRQIGDNAFYKCTGLTNTIIPGSVTNTLNGVFAWCHGLRTACFWGNTPSVGSSVFYMATNATVFYLPGTTGWGPFFDGRRTALWQLPYPVILEYGPGFGVQTNRFGFRVSWATNAAVILEASTNLVNPSWLPFTTKTLTDGWSYFADPEWTKHPARFYRVRSP